MEFALEIKKIMAKHDYMLAVRDEFQSFLMKPVLSMTERRLNQESLELFVKNRIFGAVVECVQNICKDDSSSRKKDAILLLSRSKTHFIINTGSIIEESAMEKWSALMQLWRNCDKESLKKELIKLKRQSISSESNHFEKMALLDLMIKSDNNVCCNFHPLLAGRYLFDVEIKIKLS